MLERAKKVVLSVSVLVLFGLYARQEKTGSTNGVAAVAPRGLVTQTPRTSGFVVSPIPTATATTPSATATAAVPTQTASSGGTTSQQQAAAPTRTPTPQPAKPTATSQPPTPTATAEGAYRDGDYTGTEADANWGLVQVQAVVSGGQVTDVQFLEYPNHRSRSRSINDRAMPQLVEEAVQAQQADVDIVSGATDTSEAFIQSLADALSQAAR
jgi:uncharacterized protein with FMN-binding domain